ncbi:hypothetical protein M6B38_187580 [Iris pallida]|uniref:Uncharacterized protein n=1 Tax=Iris pallida TaxID=29817 RepID=A0AAX6EIS7_IRIPA|nr:hypothetical protein M6B38_187580 [Iris pallida]
MQRRYSSPSGGSRVFAGVLRRRSSFVRRRRSASASLRPRRGKFVGQRSVLRRRTGTLMITRTRRRAGLRLRHFFGDVSFSDRSNPVSLDRLSVGLIGAHRSDPSDDGTD